MAGKQRYTAEHVSTALAETKGMLSLAAQRLGCDVDTVRNYVRRYPSVRATLQAQRCALVDTAELHLWNATQRGEQWAVQLVLKTLGKDRGYVERQEIEDGPERRKAGLTNAEAAQIRAKILGVPANGHRR